MEKIKGNQADFLLILIIILLVGIGISVLFSASYYHAERLDKPPFYFPVRQATWILLGSLIAFFISHVSLDHIRKAVPWILLAALVLSLLPFIPGLGISVNGAQRWFFILGQSFQPSEFVKFAIVLYLAYIFARKKKEIDEPVTAVFPPLIVVFVFCTIIYIQNDFSTAFFVFVVALAIFFIAQVKAFYFVMLGVIILPAVSVLLFTKVYWVKKLMVFLKPEHDTTGAGWQIIQAHAALNNGGLLGKGLGRGLKKAGVLPEGHSDFIFAVVGEEMGFAGIIFILALFICFVYRGYLIAWKCKDPFRYYLAFGISSIIFLQAILNMAVVAGLFPVSGLPLPFFSLGGTSVFMTLIMTGLLLNISRGLSLENRLVRDTEKPPRMKTPGEGRAASFVKEPPHTNDPRFNRVQQQNYRDSHRLQIGTGRE